MTTVNEPLLSNSQTNYQTEESVTIPVNVSQNQPATCDKCKNLTFRIFIGTIFGGLTFGASALLGTAVISLITDSQVVLDIYLIGTGIVCFMAGFRFDSKWGSNFITHLGCPCIYS